MLYLNAIKNGNIRDKKISHIENFQNRWALINVKDSVLPIRHRALQNSAAIFLMLKNQVGLIVLCNPFASAMSVVKRLFMYLIY